jgi:hypothetical protein
MPPKQEHGLQGENELVMLNMQEYGPPCSLLPRLFYAHHGRIKGLTLTKTKQKNSVALIRERTILTERPPLVGKVSANVCG